MSAAKLVVHVGDDYACLMVDGETTDAALVTIRHPGPKDVAMLRQWAASSTMVKALQEIAVELLADNPHGRPTVISDDDRRRLAEMVRKAIASAVPS